MFINALLMTKKYGVVTPFMFTNIVVGYLLSVFRYGEQVNPICLAGALGIVMGVVCIVRYKDQGG
jgi:drug/metabolite transporter (DMT)-like permease